MQTADPIHVNYRIRSAVSDDSKQLVALVEQLGYPADERFIRDQLARLTSQPGTTVFVADDDDAIIGLLCFSIIPLLHVSGGLGRISALVVGSQFKGQGVGRRLVAEAEEFAWNNGCARIEITSGDHRPDAHAFYEAIGYEQDSRRFIKSRPATRATREIKNEGRKSDFNRR
jgi:GNAT superfamily N-acetyltransferase